MVGYRRRVLGALSRVELLEVGGLFGVAIGRHMSLEQMQDATAASSARLVDILPMLSRSTLKAVCDAVGLDRTSREKQPLVERILRAELAASDPGSAPPVSPRERPSMPPAP